MGWLLRVYDLIAQLTQFRGRSGREFHIGLHGATRQILARNIPPCLFGNGAEYSFGSLFACHLPYHHVTVVIPLVQDGSFFTPYLGASWRIAHRRTCCRPQASRRFAGVPVREEASRRMGKRYSTHTAFISRHRTRSPWTRGMGTPNATVCGPSGLSKHCQTPGYGHGVSDHIRKPPRSSSGSGATREGSGLRKTYTLSSSGMVPSS